MSQVVSIIDQIQSALKQRRSETARRLCVQAFSGDGKQSKEISLLFHETGRQLDDLSVCRDALALFTPENNEERFELLLRQAEDTHLSSHYPVYRLSPECKAGLTLEEYQAKYQALATSRFTEAASLAGNQPALRTKLGEVLKRCNRAALVKEWGIEEASGEVFVPAVSAVAQGCGVVSGTLKFPDGQPVKDALVTLGLKLEVKFGIDPEHELLTSSEGYEIRFGPQHVLTARTNEAGQFRIESVPAETHEFLSVTLDALSFDIQTRFLAQGVTVQAGQEVGFDRVVDEWSSAPAELVESPFSEELDYNGIKYRRIGEQKFRNPFFYSFRRQAVRVSLPPGVTTNPERLLVLSAPGQPEPFQVIGREVLFFTDLPQDTRKLVALYEAVGGQSTASSGQGDLVPVPAQDGLSATIDTGRASFRIPWGNGTDALPPLLAVRGEDGVWRGRGRFRLPAGVSILSRSTTVMEVGPLFLQVEVAYAFSNRTSYTIRFTAHRDEAYLLARETSPEIEGASFEFSLQEFSGGRGYLNWCPLSGLHWSKLSHEDVEIARLQESVSWWSPTQGFGYGMTKDGLTERDYIGVFTIRRGEWIDRKFAGLTEGPVDADGKENRELDWPFPEMVGSTISMITVHTDTAGDAYFKFGFFDGERQWGILVSTFERNDGNSKEISNVQHSNSSPRLDEFKDWRLDEPDHQARPAVVARRKDLRRLRAKKSSPVFAPIWEKVAANGAKCDNWFSHNVAGPQVGPGVGLHFAVDGDPRSAWLMKRELVNAAGVYSKAILYGRDISDAYSPVGGRPIAPWAENYDLIAASGVFTPEEERLVRSFLMLMGHMYSNPDFMNWRNNSRNANFESDRVDAVGTIGVAFWGNPDADNFVSHASGSMERALNAYCTPGSGKWFENPPCYYLQSVKCRASLVVHLAEHGLMDPTRLPRFKDFLRWAIILLTPPAPKQYEVMANGCAADAYAAENKIRRIPPIGDHAYIGWPISEYFPLMAKLYRERDPEFANELMWAYQSGGSAGEAYSNFPFLFASLEEEDLRPATAISLESRRLEGFGAVLRGSFNQPDEFYLLLKQGPGGYRYHRTEGSFLLFADGKPLVYDGGEAGETWRHSTLSFYDTHMPLSAGHVERSGFFPGMDFVQGVHPCAIKPGEPIFLNDDCHHDLVKVAYARFAEPHPADVRSTFWVKDEYVVLHDELNIDAAIPSYWHLQVVAGGETGDSQTGYRFKGRFGTDLQVLLPDQRFLAESCERVPHLEFRLTPETSFAMRHLQLKGDRPELYLAVLRPLSGGKKPVQAKLIPNGVQVTGEGIDDLLFFKRDGVTVDRSDARFAGRYGSILRRPDFLQLCLLDGQSLEADGVRIESDGPSVYLKLQGTRVELRAEGNGRVRLTVKTRETEIQVKDGGCSIWMDL